MTVHNTWRSQSEVSEPPAWMLGFCASTGQPRCGSRHNLLPWTQYEVICWQPKGHAGLHRWKSRSAPIVTLGVMEVSWSDHLVESSAAGAGAAVGAEGVQ